MTFSFSCRRLVLLLIAAAGLLAPWQAGMAADPVPEYKMKAAFAYNFALFADWPEGAAGDSFVICINADSRVRAAMDELHGRLLRNQRIAVRSMANIDNPRGCQLLYIDRLDRERWPVVRKNIGSDSILTITDDSEIGRDGAMIFLELLHDRVMFDIDLNAARLAKLSLSSKLLRLARSTR